MTQLRLVYSWNNKLDTDGRLRPSKASPDRSLTSSEKPASNALIAKMIKLELVRPEGAKIIERLVDDLLGETRRKLF